MPADTHRMLDGKHPPVFIRIVLTLSALFVALLPAGAAAQAETGIIAGIIQDPAGQPIPFANVLISGVGGVIAAENGRFQFDDVPVGIHTLTVKHISSEDVTVEDVLVKASQVTRVGRITLQEAIAAELQGIKISEQRRDKLGKVESQMVRVIDTKEQSKIRAINTTEEAIATQAGVVQLGDNLFVRGGRSSEVKTVVDGMPVSDAFTGSTGSGTMDISIASQEGINVLTGGFDAEYGNAQSGIIEVSTKEGGEYYEGQVKFITDDFGAPDRTYFNYDNISFGFGGPVPFAEDVLKFYVSGEGVFQDTYLKTLEQRPAKTLVFNGTELATFRDRQNNAMRGQAKVTYTFPGSKKISGEYLFSRTEDDWYHHAFSRVGFWSESRDEWWFEPLDTTYTYYNGPAHLSERKSDNAQYKLVYTHPLTNDSYVTVRGALFRNVYNENVSDKSPEEYVPFFGNDPERDPDNLFFAIRGDFPYWEERESNQYTLRGDFQNRVGDGTGDGQHTLKTGFTLDYYDLRRDQRNYPSEFNPEGSNHNDYDERALGGVIYAQDRLRYKKSMVMNAGLRFDFFDPGVNAVRISNQRVTALERPMSGTSFLERVKAQISPRLGMSYPISDKDVLHFHYGRFFQLPDLQYLYDYSNNANPGNATVGNSFLDPETTISYQFGVRRQLSDTVYMDATVFFKDIFGLVDTEALVAENAQEDVLFGANTYINRAYGSSRGFELAIDKNFSDYWQGGVAYTLSRASGSSSNVNQGIDVGLDREPIKEVPLDWDRTHVISAYLYFSDPGIWGLNFDLSVSSGSPTTPRRLGQRTVQAEDINTIRLPPAATVSLRGNKQYSLYGQEFRLFLEGRNLLNRKNVRTDQPTVWPTPTNDYYQEYYTEFGELGGAYNLADTAGATEDVLIPLNDPRVYGEPRLFRVGLQFEF